MTKNRWIAVLSGLVAAVLLVLLLQPTPTGSAERVLAVALLVALILLTLLYARSERGALEDLGHARDELARKLDDMETELADSKAFSQSLLDGVSDPAIIFDRQFNVSAINKAALRRLDRDTADGEILPCYRALHGRDTPCDPKEHPCVLTTGESCKHLRKWLDADGTERLVELRATPLFDENGEITGAVEVLHDLNEQERLALRLQRAREDAETAHAARAKFVATMSHEVRTPLNAVLGMTDLLRLTSLTRKQKSYVQIMESSSNMLLSLVDNMIDFATIESGRLELKSESFYVTDLLERVLEIMGYQAYSKGIELAGATDFEADTQVCGDFHRLQQIMINLVGNAIKFTDAGEVIISVGVETDGSGASNLTVSVSDTGIGMSQEITETLFTPFGPMTAEIGRTNQGSGLGLMISRELIDRMKGRISLESTPGRGTKAWFTVPLAPVPDSGRSIIGGRRVLSNRRLLLVHANPEVSRSIASFLTAWDMSSDTEQQHEEVPRRLEAARKSGYPFDCIVLDVDNAASDRLAVARAIREQTDLPIVLLTSIAQPLEVGQVSTIPSTRCVDKPVLPSVLRYNLSRLFEMDLGEPGTVDDDFQSLRILIAEDNPINRKLLNGMLSSLDFDVDTVNDGPAVLTALEESAYDLILMDCQMPGMDGDEVTRVIREGKLPRAGQPVVVAVTADISVQHKEKCMQAGMDDFLAKPVRLDMLKAGLRRWALMANSRRRQLPDASQFQSTSDADIIGRLQDRMGMIDSKALDEFITLFVDDASARIEVMRHALTEHDLHTVRRECHALKGACLELGVTSLGNCCEALGKASRDNRVADLPAEFDRLAAEFRRVRPIFEEDRSRPG